MTAAKRTDAKTVTPDDAVESLENEGGPVEGEAVEGEAVEEPKTETQVALEFIEDEIARLETYANAAYLGNDLDLRRRVNIEVGDLVRLRGILAKKVSLGK